LLDSAVRVVILPNWQSLVDVAERNEHRLVERLVAQSPVEVLDEGIPLQLAQAPRRGCRLKKRVARMKAAAAAAV
jgi:hypothetical protein